MLGANAISINKDGKVPIPSHFNTEYFLVGAFDNFYHQDKSSFSNPSDDHDTAIVLFQSKTTTSQNCNKGKVSEMKDINIIKREYIDELDCQKVIPYRLTKKSLPLPTNFTSKKFEYEADSSEECLSVIKNSNIPKFSTNLPTWSGAHSLTTTKRIELKKVGFLPIIPHPVTEIETVYSCLINFKKIAESLKQKNPPYIL